MEILKTIIPIFAIIFFGLLARKKQIITESFLAPANRLTYFLAIPALIFRAVAKSDFVGEFNAGLLIGTLLPLVIVYFVSWIICSLLKVDIKQRGTLIESTMHGNVGYIGLAVVFYYLGQGSMATAAILTSFMALLHNSLAVIVLQTYADRGESRQGTGEILVKIIGNPIIIVSVASILYSLSGLGLPIIIDRTLGILGNLALPLALLVIGASLSFKLETRLLVQMGLVSFAKLLVLPTIGFVLYQAFNLTPDIYLTGLILLSCPVATVVYILAAELKGDRQLAVNIVSTTTALSIITISFWLNITF